MYVCMYVCMYALIHIKIAPGMYAELPNGLQFDEARSEGEIWFPHTLHHMVVLACMYVCMYV